MSSKKIYTGLSWFAIIATPLAPVFFFGHKIYLAISGFDVWGHWLIATGVGILSAIGLELIGILAGHACIEYVKQKQLIPASLAGVILLVYTAIGIYELQGTIGPVLYLMLIRTPNLLAFSSASRTSVNPLLGFCSAISSPTKSFPLFCPLNVHHCPSILSEKLPFPPQKLSHVLFSVLSPLPLLKLARRP